MDKTLVSDGVLKPGEIIRPKINKEDVPYLVKKFYGLETKLVKELNGYDDKNFFIEVAKSENPFIQCLSENGYVLKILNSKDSECQDVIEAQNNLMQHLNQSEIGVFVPLSLKNMEGNHFSYEIVHDIDKRADISNSEDDKSTVGKKHIVRLLQYIPGMMMKDVQYTKGLLYEVGKLSGRFYNELKNFHSETIMKRKTIWQLGSFPLLHNFLFSITDEKKRKLAKEILSSFESLVVPIIPSLEKSIIHGDFNEQNIITSSNREHSPFRTVFGLLDFGDISFSPCIFELAITIAYVVLEVNIMDPNDAAGYVVAGYISERKIIENEWNILWECVAARIAQSLILGAYSYLHNPGNEYLLYTAKTGWERLQQFWSTPKDELITKWKSMMSLQLSKQH